MKTFLLLAVSMSAWAQTEADWPSLNGDVSGRRFSPLHQIDTRTVGGLTEAWHYKPGTGVIKGTPVIVKGVMYITLVDNIWAVDASTGREIWHFHRPGNGDRIANRGVAVYRDNVYFGTPDAFLVCLKASSGEKLWEIAMADVNFGYYLSLIHI